MSKELVEVTQADREAAADLAEQCNPEMCPMLADFYREGGDSPLVQAFARHRIASASPRPAETELVEDAARWRALLDCGRIRVLGAANVPDEDPCNWVHFGAEFWSSYPLNAPHDNTRGIECLTVLADRLRSDAALKARAE